MHILNERRIYENYIDFCKECFRVSLKREIMLVTGLWFKSRAAISTKTEKFFDEISFVHKFLRLLTKNVIVRLVMYQSS